MNRNEFQKLLSGRIVFFDGATGTNLQKAGMPNGVCPEKWITDHRNVMLQLQKDYVSAGTDILLAPTFGANRIKLAEYGLADEIVPLTKELVGISEEAAEGKALVAGDMTMTGRSLEPVGDMTFDELVDVYREQAELLLEAGVDLYIVETMMSLQETRAAVIAIREVTEELPILASMTFEPGGTSLFGATPESAAVVLAALGADCVGMNCSTGPSDMIPILRRMKEVVFVPVFAKPNAGLPKLVDGVTVYDMEPEEFTELCVELVKTGANIIGGCCGTTPAHIKALYDRVHDMEVPRIRDKYPVVASVRRICELSPDRPFQVVGERINPTGKKKLQESLRAGSFDIVTDFAKSQEADGAAILDVNMGTNGVDEKQCMLTAIEELGYVTDLPLCLDSSSPEVLEAALKAYQGRALLNSISLERIKIEELLPVAKKYGAMFILLPLSDSGLPENMEEKHRFIDEILENAYSLGFTKEDVVVDGLVATVGANPMAAMECISTIRHCHDDLGLPTICGLSNISFGLPERGIVNTAFLTMAILSGLSLAIANPAQDMLMNAAAAADLLMNREGADLKYIDRVGKYTQKMAETSQMKLQKAAPEKAETLTSTTEDEKDPGPVYRAVIDGARAKILEITVSELEEGKNPEDILNFELIPAINKVGELFEKKKYFLPQLIASADAMQISISHIEPLLATDDEAEEKPVVVVATVEGDIHDIGKNLVVLMLKNYGFDVIDLGKDVPAEVIIDEAIAKGAAVIGLSALMTTTMMRMKEVVEKAKEKDYPGKIIIGGAAVTESFASEIGADGYSKDAAECVKLVKNLLDL